MHVGDNGDQGGNLLQVRFFGDGSNLHRVWDSQVMDRHTKNERVWLWDFDFIANPRRVVEWSKGAPEDWATETLLVAKRMLIACPGTQNDITRRQAWKRLCQIRAPGPSKGSLPGPAYARHLS